jgi:hypothetical protein
MSALDLIKFMIKTFIDSPASQGLKIGMRAMIVACVAEAYGEDWDAAIKRTNAMIEVTLPARGEL